MISKTRKSGKNLLKQVFPYLLISVAIIGLVFYGSQDKTATDVNTMNMESIANNNFNVSADQLSEFYVVSQLAHTMSLPTAEAVNLNYNSLTVMRDVGQTAVDKLEKPSIVDTSHLSRGVVSHTVSDGENIQTIAQDYGVSTTQIRWSNNLKTDDLSIGQVVNIPSVPGIIYTVKAGDSIASLAEKYKSDAESITSANDLEETGELVVGSTIILPSGELPETERPEYVAPVTTYSYGSYASSYTRTYWTSANPMPWGWCTWYAWEWRYQHMPENYRLPGGLGNANMWANALRSSFYIDKTPQYGDVFVDYSGYYGHVGIVTAVKGDIITIEDMNGVRGWGAVGSKDVSRSTWAAWEFIHQKR